MCTTLLRHAARRTMAVLPALSLALAFGCAGGGGSGGTGEMAPEEQSFSVVAEGTDSNFVAASGDASQGSDLVIASQSELDAFWSAHGAPPADEPAVDFASEIVLAVTLGERAVEGYGIEIARVAEDPSTGALEVEVVEDEPADLATAAQAIVRPYSIARTARPPAPRVAPPYPEGVSADASGQVVAAFHHLKRLKFETVDKGDRSCWISPDATAAASAAPIDRPHLLGFRDEAEWRRFWVQHSCAGTAPPSIDFSKDMAIAYIAGYGSGASAVEVKEILYDHKRDLIFVRVEEDRSPVTGALRNPYHIVRCRSVPGTLVLRQEAAWPFRSLDLGAISGYRYGDPSFGGENLILRDERSYFWLWKEHTSNQQPPPPPPAVHFPREMALASFFGYWPTSGASIEIVGIRRTWFGALRVDLAKRVAPGMLPVVTNPYHIVATQMWLGPVFFVERRVP